MRRTLATTTAIAVAAGLAAIIPASPASATITASTTGTKLVVTLTGESYLDIACSGGKVATVDTGSGPDVTTVASPALACSALTQVEVTGDSARQNVGGDTLDLAAFSALPKLVASLGDGADTVSESRNADSIDLGPGEDYLLVRPGGTANTKLDMGTGNFDAAAVSGTELDDAIVATSSSVSATISVTTTGTTRSVVVTNAKRFLPGGNAGNDTFSTTGVTAASSMKSISANGGAGDDTFAVGVIDSTLDGGAGTNTYHLGTGADSVFTQTQTDIVDGATDAKRDLVVDTNSLRFGGRTLTGFANSAASADVYQAASTKRDVTIRLRPNATGTLETMSLHRSGQQQIPSNLDFIETSVPTQTGDAAHKVLVDVAMGAQGSRWYGSGIASELFDITAPATGWSEIPSNQEVSIQISGAAPVILPAASTRLVHAPWPNANTSFAHRATRDLLFKFLTTPQRTDLATKLGNGTTTRAKAVSAIVNSDEYRGLDVDRTFVQFLRRKADAGGRSYWVSSLRSGKALWRFRAQLLGSNEYFSKAGGTNAAFVTKAYNDVLGRTPDPSGLAYWTNKLDAGADRGSVALQFLSSTEARRNIVKDQFLRFLDRFPTTAEENTWIATLGSSTTGEQDLIASLAGSAAYANRT